MEKWTEKLLAEHVLDYEKMTETRKKFLSEYLEKNFPFNIYEHHRQCRRMALENEKKIRDYISTAEIFYPELLFPEKNLSAAGINGCAIVLTAGGEGERLRLSLADMGYSFNINEFTKATFALPGFYKNFGTLQTNLALIAHIAAKTRSEIPVIITTGPAGSATAEIIPDIIRKHNNFGLKNLLIIEQQERLHLTNDEKIACASEQGNPVPVTNPDETGGPLMSLKQKRSDIKSTPIEWITGFGTEKILILQATALYNPDLIYAMANTGKNHDCIGVGILREKFEDNDPFGTYTGIIKDGKRKVMIIEQNICTEKMRTLMSGTKYYLPYNTGFYAFSTKILGKTSLPDYATPPKEILQGVERSPKIGYAATDLITLAENPAVLAVTSDWFAVLKNADSLAQVSALGRACGIDRILADSGF